MKAKIEIHRPEHSHRIRSQRPGVHDSPAGIYRPPEPGWLRRRNSWAAGPRIFPSAWAGRWRRSPSPPTPEPIWMLPGTTPPSRRERKPRPSTRFLWSGVTGTGFVLDFRRKKDGALITVEDLEKALKKIRYRIKPRDIVLIMTGADRAWGKPEYLIKGAGMGRESTLWLLDQGVKVVGIDAWSWDRPLPFLKKEFEENGRCHDSLGGPLCGDQERIPAYREDGQPAQTSPLRFHPGLFSGKNSGGERRLGAAGGHRKRIGRRAQGRGPRERDWSSLFCPAP